MNIFRLLFQIKEQKKSFWPGWWGGASWGGGGGGLE